MRILRSPAWTVLTLIVVLSCSSLALVINGATIAGTQLTITGTGFIGTPIVVTFNGKTIPVISSSPTQIVATLNPVPSAGTYRLFVRAGSASNSSYVSVPIPAVFLGFCPYSAPGFWVSMFGAGDEQSHCPDNDSMSIPIPSNGVLSNLRVEGNFDGTVAVWVNRVQTVLSCTITDSPPNSRSKCSDLTDQILVNAGDEISLEVNGTTQVDNARAAFEFRAR